MSWGLLFLALMPWVGEPSVGLGSSSLQEGTAAAKIPLLILNRRIVGVGPARSMSPALLPGLVGCFICLVTGIPFS